MWPGKKTKPRRARALLIEDICIHRSTVTRLLEQAGIDVVATNGPAGVDLIERRTFDLLICGLRLTQADALGAIKNARRQGIPSVAVAPGYSAQEAYEACRLGADSVWAHPVDAERFLDCIARIVPSELMRYKPSNSPRPVVLLIDDNRETRACLRRTLEPEGFITLEASSGSEGILTFVSNNVDLVVLDVVMPGLNGLMTCRIIKERSNTPVLMCTVRSDEDDQLAAISAAADDYLIKPFRPEDLIKRVNRLLEAAKPCEVAP